MFGFECGRQALSFKKKVSKAEKLVFEIDLPLKQ